MKLPAKLNKEPLIDAVFECRFLSQISAASVLPGFLFSKLDGEKTIVDLPIRQIPESVRSSNPNMKFASLVRLNWSDFSVSVGDKNLVVGCRYPYPGWAVFKRGIEDIMSLVKEASIVQSVSRYSMKYVDLIPSTSLLDQVNMINLTLNIGEHTLRKEKYSIHVEFLEEEFLHIVKIISSANANLENGESRKGVVIDVDSIKEIEESYFIEWLDKLPPSLDKLHMKNKQIFFRCLREKTIIDLEPIYD